MFQTPFLNALEYFYSIPSFLKPFHIKLLDLFVHKVLYSLKCYLVSKSGLLKALSAETTFIASTSSRTFATNKYQQLLWKRFLLVGNGKKYAKAGRKGFITYGVKCDLKLKKLATVNMSLSSKFVVFCCSRSVESCWPAESPSISCVSHKSKLRWLACPQS